MIDGAPSELPINMMDLAEKPFRPPQIMELKAEIEGRTRALELRETVTGEIDDVEIQNIVGLKLKLDELYGLWTIGKLE